MEVFVVDPAEPEAGEAIEHAAEALRAGRLVVLPTDTVYGIACRPDAPEATAGLFAAKRRPAGLNLPVLVATAAEALSLAVSNPQAEALAGAFWPGPLTVVLPRSGRSAEWSLGDLAGTIALRVPEHPVALAILSRTGPLAVSSANRSGEPPTTAEELVAVFGGNVSVYLIVEHPIPVPPRMPSTVVDLTGPAARVSRAGVVDARRIAEALLGTGLDLDSLD